MLIEFSPKLILRKVQDRVKPKVIDSFMSLPSNPQTYHTLMVLAAAAHTVDLITTQMFLTKGVIEPNPFLIGSMVRDFGVTYAVPIKAVGLGVTLALCEGVRRITHNQYPQYSYRIPILGLRAQGGLTAIVAGLNLLSHVSLISS